MSDKQMNIFMQHNIPVEIHDEEPKSTSENVKSAKTDAQITNENVKTDNMLIYNKVRFVPQEAKKQIIGGKLKGMTDINPMWRIKCLTETFGPCGFGWKIEEKEKWTSEVNGETIVNVSISLYVKWNGEWSEAILGYGGNKIGVVNKNGLEANDEAYKMALTDAISVACKSLGIGADVYWDADRTKYTDNTVSASNDAPKEEMTVAKRRLIQINEAIKGVFFNGTRINFNMLNAKCNSLSGKNISDLDDNQFDIFFKEVVLSLQKGVAPTITRL